MQKNIGGKASINTRKQERDALNRDPRATGRTGAEQAARISSIDNIIRPKLSRLWAEQRCCHQIDL